jgi:hypothetical protein
MIYGRGVSKFWIDLQKESKKHQKSSKTGQKTPNMSR